MEKMQETIVEEIEEFDSGKELQILEEQIAKIIDSYRIHLMFFKPQMAEILEQEPTPDMCVKAKNLRNKILKIRTSLDKERKARGNFFKDAKNVIDSNCKILIDEVAGFETDLKLYETYFERKKAEEMAKLRDERLALLAKFEWVADDTVLESLAPNMFDLFLKDIEEKFVARKKAERLEAEEKERLRLDNERLAAEVAKLEVEKKELTTASVEKVIVHSGLSDGVHEYLKKVFYDMTAKVDSNQSLPNFIVGVGENNGVAWIKFKK